MEPFIVPVRPDIRGIFKRASLKIVLLLNGRFALKKQSSKYQHNVCGYFSRESCHQIKSLMFGDAWCSGDSVRNTADYFTGI